MTDAVSPTTLLIVLDGWGHRDDAPDNAISRAHTPVWDALWKQAPTTLVSGSGLDVGLPAGQMGNSEVGHMNLGAGRVVYQDLTRIDQAIATGTFADTPAIAELLAKLAAHGRTLHVMGLLSPGGVHSHEDQIFALIELAVAHGVAVKLHAFLDGRDTPPRSAKASLERFEAAWPGVIGSMTGRFYAMDRDNRWDRVRRAYDLIQLGEASFHAPNAVDGLARAYGRDENDEFVQPTAIHAPEESPVTVRDGDGVIFMNFRADRAREITRAFLESDFDGFERRSRAELTGFVSLTQYADDIDTTIAFAPEHLANTLGEYLATMGKTQLRIAETEKYAHVTFFFSGGREESFTNESRILIESPKVETYDQVPEMSAREVTDQMVEAIDTGRHDVIVCNFANGDMVGHTGVFEAAKQAVETLDECLGRIRAAVDRTGSQCLVTADHGNAEQMTDETSGQPHTAHTSEPVPLVYIGKNEISLASGGVLSDIAPTILDLMKLPIPDEMTGRSLVTRKADDLEPPRPS